MATNKRTLVCIDILDVLYNYSDMVMQCGVKYMVPRGIFTGLYRLDTPDIAEIFKLNKQVAGIVRREALDFYDDAWLIRNAITTLNGAAEAHNLRYVVFTDNDVKRTETLLKGLNNCKVIKQVSRRAGYCKRNRAALYITARTSDINEAKKQGIPVMLVATPRVFHNQRFAYELFENQDAVQILTRWDKFVFSYKKEEVRKISKIHEWGISLDNVFYDTRKAKERQDITNAVE